MRILSAHGLHHAVSIGQVISGRVLTINGTVAGSVLLFVLGPVSYLASVTGLGILLATFTSSMPQFGLLALPVLIVMNLLSGSTTPMESMPDWQRMAM